MAEKTIAQKLFLKPGAQALFFQTPPDFDLLLGELPAITRLDESSAPVDFILAFIANRARLESVLPSLKQRLKPGGILWIAYHKGTSTTRTDINRDSINAYGHTLGLQGVAMVAINEDWAALRLKVV